MGCTYLLQLLLMLGRVILRSFLVGHVVEGMFGFNETQVEFEIVLTATLYANLLF